MESLLLAMRIIKKETRMSKRHILKEVNAKSMCGMEIVVEQIYENIYEKFCPS